MTGRGLGRNSATGCRLGLGGRVGGSVVVELI